MMPTMITPSGERPTGHCVYRDDDGRVFGTSEQMMVQIREYERVLRMIQEAAADDIRLNRTGSPCVFTVEAEARAAMEKKR